jgi:GR25 family glycosyltransferase involved in LPS biosynthesis
MKVGVTTHVQYSFFSGGAGGTSLAIAEVFRNLGYEVWLINTNGDAEWWDDCKSMREAWKNSMVNGVGVREGKLPGDGKPFDLIIEVERTFFMSTEERRKATGPSGHCVWLHRKSAVFHDIEASLYPFDMAKRCVDGLSAVWMFDATTTEDDKNYLETVARCPVYRVPFTWTPSYVEVHRGETKAPEWLQVTEALGADKPWSVHICETNNSASSSLTLPLVILHHTKEKTSFPFVKWTAHNADAVLRSTFFKNNVKAHCEIQGLSGEFIGRQRLIDWIYDPKSCVLTHMRFNTVRPFLLDAVWTGVPMIHNSPWVRDLVGTGYERLYYSDNEIIAASACFETLEADFKARKGIFSPDVRASTKQMLLEKVSPYSVAICNAWKAAVATLQGIQVPMAVPLLATTPTPVIVAAPIAPVPSVVAPPVASVPSAEKTLKILFTDMWDEFNPNYNMFTLMLNEAGRHLNPPVRVEGYGPTDSRKPDVCIFGPFGSKWTGVGKDVPKVHFTGENSMIISCDDVKLNIGFQHADFKDQDYLRLPLWMLEIDWFGCDKELIANPKPLSIDACTKVDPDIARRKKFCAFVVTNPCNPVRNSAFHWLSNYKQVDSAGRLFNNVGDVIFAGRGGGGGELKKFEFLRDYKFCLAYENSSCQGYTTEKFLHAKAAGCIPIYWGDPKVERDFDTKGFINAQGFTRPEELIDAVRAMDTDQDAWLKAYSVPALDDTRRDLVRRTLSECARRILRLGLGADVNLDSIPRFLGGATDAEAAALSKKAHDNSIILLSAATNDYLPSLCLLLKSAIIQTQLRSVSFIGEIWLGADIDEPIANALRIQYPWVQFNRFPTDTPADFPDLWNPKHFAWKLWIYQHIVNLPKYKDSLCMYLDSGIFMCDIPTNWLTSTKQNGICLFNDANQKNLHWCHEEFCRILSVTHAEKEQYQTVGGIVSFIGGAAPAVNLFNQSWIYAQKKDVIVGSKWTGYGSDGHPYGHRHDQSILSILSNRLNISRIPLDTVYCDTSFAKTLEGKKALYVHRGTAKDYAEVEAWSPFIIPKGVNTFNIVNSATVSKPIIGIHMTTMASRRFLPSLHQLLCSMAAQQKNTPFPLNCTIWLADDIEVETEVELQKEFNWMRFERFPTLQIPGFEDIWDPKHYAWKIWILKTMANRQEMNGHVVLYMDSGVFMCRWPTEYIQITNQNGICFLNDANEINGRWCHDDFCRELCVTETEKKENQIWAGVCAFVTGHEIPVRLFEEAWVYAQKRHVIIGSKWTGVSLEGKSFGHRHDQSILSILSSRKRLPRYPMDSVYASESLRKTFMSKKAFYVHRGTFTVHKQFTEGIDDCYVINLDRRADRMEKLYTNMPSLQGRVSRISAVEGCKLQMTPAIARLFRPHDFKWKKPVLGCALSHLRVWWQLANERDDIDSYLILEDDVKMSPDWEARWKAAVPHIPEDFDIIYLGGILPPNREGFEAAKEPVNAHFSRVKENSFFGQTKPNRYFHWCAYSYVLSRKGARKVLEILMAKDGYWTSADHMLCNPVEFLSIYFLDPLVAGCYQDEDPRYQGAAFNDFTRKDEFDSDLWNNNEHFNTTDCEAMGRLDGPPDIARALADSLQINSGPTTTEQSIGKQAPEVAKERLREALPAHPLWRQLESAVMMREPLLGREIAFQIMQAWQMEWNEKTDEDFTGFLNAMSDETFAGLPSKNELAELYKQWSIITDSASQAGRTWPEKVRRALEVYMNYLPRATDPPKKMKGRRILKLKQQVLDLGLLYEGKWLKELFGEGQDLCTEDISLGDPLPKDEPILLVMKPWWSTWMPILQRLAETNTKFYVIHLSDEFVSDPIEFYGLAQCLGVVRMYWRKELEQYGEKVTVIPLGYHWTRFSGMKNPMMDTPRLPFREFTWSFAGTDWRGRKEAMKVLEVIKPNYLRWFAEWNDPGMLSEDAYLSMLLNSKFVPIPAGNNHETYRFYEALECGCIPMYIRQPGDEMLVDKHFKAWLPIVDLPSWDHAAALMFQLSNNPEVMEQYRNGILDGYRRWKLETATKIRATLRI